VIARFTCGNQPTYVESVARRRSQIPFDIEPCRIRRELSEFDVTVADVENRSVILVVEDEESYQDA